MYKVKSIYEINLHICFFCAKLKIDYIYEIYFHICLQASNREVIVK